jgi:hypothetical protein
LILACLDSTPLFHMTACVAVEWIALLFVIPAPLGREADERD